MCEEITNNMEDVCFCGLGRVVTTLNACLEVSI